MPLDKPSITQALRRVPDPARGVDLIEAGIVQNIASCDGHVSLKINATGQESITALDRIAERANAAVRSGAAPESLTALVIEWTNASGRVVHTHRFEAGRTANATTEQPGTNSASTPAVSRGHTPIPGLAQSDSGGALPGVRRVIAVGAGKGGVGKSTIAVNLAVGLARRAQAVGVLDADIYGPSFPTMLGLHDLEQATVGGRLQPFAVHGVKAITLGKLVDADKPLIWRGPMAHGAFKQLAEQTNWGELDTLVIDLPPGTGDIALTMAQTLRLTGAVIVCTPQRVAQDDAARAAGMFKQLGIEVLGVVENMSYFVGDPDEQGRTKTYDLFGRGGARRMAERLGLPFLGEVPITMALRENSDGGDPSANFARDTALARSLDAMVDAVERQASLASVRSGKQRPTLSVS